MTRLRLLLAFLAVALLPAPGLARQSTSLDGEWECAYGDPKAPPAAEASWEPIQVPSVRQWRPTGPHALWYRRLFHVPPSWAARRIFMTFDGVKYKQRLLVNGKEAGQHVGGFEATEYDITGQVIPGGANELLVAVEDWTALIGQGAKVGTADPFREFGSWVEGGLIAPLGSEGWEMGIWGSVAVQARPPVWVESALVQPSVRTRMLRVHVTVRNGGTTEDATAVTARIAGGGAGPSFPSQVVAVPAGQEKTVTLQAEWPKPRLWSPQDPHLYTLVVGARTGVLGDSLEVRFGFREFWVEGDRFFLNGVPTHLLAAAAMPMPQYDADPGRAYEIAESADCSALALRGQPRSRRWYEAADEAGLLLVAGSALYHLGSSYALTRDEFWTNARDHLTSLVKQRRNHPSVVVWSAADELLASGGAKVAGVEQKAGALADLVRSLDPTRPVMFDGDADPAGKADIISLHRPRAFAHMRLWPASAYWLDAPALLDGYPGTVWQWERDKPLWLADLGRLSPAEVSAASVFFGDDVSLDTESHRLAAQATALEVEVIAARDAGVSGICPATMPVSPSSADAEWEALTRAFRPVAAFPREASSRFFAGTVVDRTLMVLNDSRDSRSLELHWRLTPVGGGWEVAGRVPLTLAPAARQRIPLAVAVPEIAAGVEEAVLSLELWEGRQLLCSTFQQWKLHTREGLSGKVPAPPSRVAIYDPRGETTALLAQLGVESLPISQGDARRALHFVSVAVVGKGALGGSQGASDALLADLAEFVRSGGVLLVFEQESYPSALIPLPLSDHEWAIAFPRSADHPLLAGIEAADLAHWLPDGVVTRRGIVKPARVGFLPIVDSGGERGLQTAGLAELRLGDGRMVLCQLEVTSTFGPNPIAAKLIRNLLQYAAAPPPRGAVTGVFCDDATAKLLDAVGLKYDRLAWPLPSGALRHYQALLLCNLDRGISEPARVQDFIREGGRVVLHQVTPDSLELTQRVVGQRFVLKEMGRGPVSLTQRDGPAAGMSNEEFAWMPAGPPIAGLPLPTGDIADYTVSALVAGPTHHTTPGVLVSGRLGTGLWVVDQVKWQDAGPFTEKAERYLAILLTNLQSLLNHGDRP